MCKLLEWYVHWQCSALQDEFCTVAEWLPDKKSGKTLSNEQIKPLPERGGNEYDDENFNRWAQWHFQPAMGGTYLYKKIESKWKKMNWKKRVLEFY